MSWLNWRNWNWCRIGIKCEILVLGVLALVYMKYAWHLNIDTLFVVVYSGIIGAVSAIIAFVIFPEKPEEQGGE